ncbi:MAG: M3 family oligoendopeptidase [Patescibacteria group bacterium]
MQHSTKTPVWNLKLLYSSDKDPRIETDIRTFEKNVTAFATTYDVSDRGYLEDASFLQRALVEYEKLIGQSGLKALMYFYYLRDSDASNTSAPAHISLIENRLAKVQNSIVFFENSLGKISLEKQKLFLEDPLLSHHKIFLQRIFSQAIHDLSIPEERILNLKSQPAHSMWVSANESIMNMRTVTWKGKKLPLSEALQVIHTLPTSKSRQRLSMLTADVLKTLAVFSEKEINAVFTDKKIDDELRGYSTPYAQTIMRYHNDPIVIEQLIKTVEGHSHIAHRFFKLKARLLKQKKLFYSDRGASIGTIKSKFSFEKSTTLLKSIYDKINPKFSQILDSYIQKGQIDVSPRIGKTGGAYCWSTYLNPTFVLLNHTNDFRSFITYAHEMGHAFHGEFSRSQGPLYSSYSMSLAETASTLFQVLALEAVYETLPDAEKIILLHDKISADISTIYRQIACFNFERDLHRDIRAKGFLTATEIGELHNVNMKKYLGPAVTLVPEDGYMFVQWSHIRRFFYVYSYAYGMLVSKSFLRRYKQDPSFWPSIEKFLSAGGKDSPENILKEIGVDVSGSDFWIEGLKEIEDDIAKLEKLTKSKKS